MAHMRGQVDFPALGAERREVGDGGLRARQQDNIRAGRKRLTARDHF